MHAMEAYVLAGAVIEAAVKAIKPELVDEVVDRLGESPLTAEGVGEVLATIEGAEMEVSWS